jgi:KDO2-lipid IV(A) lauroyltransferase
MGSLLYYSVLFISSLLNVMPYKLIDALASFFGSVFYMVAKRRRNDALVNLDIAFPEKSCEEKVDIAKECSKNFAYVALEFIKNLKTPKEELIERVVFNNENIIHEALKAKKPIVFMTAHFGNWELGSLICALFPKSLVAIGRESGNAALDRLMKQSRERFNVTLVSKHGAMKHIIKEIKQGGSVGVLVDQNTSEDEGVLIDFFGYEARHTPVLSILAKRFNALIIPAFAYRDGSRYMVDVHTPLEADKTLSYEEDIKRLTQAQADVTKNAIKKSPSEYFWFHRRWKNRYEHLYQQDAKCG